MPQRFIACDRDQAFLMPPSLLQWIDQDHLVWTVLDSVAELDLSAFYAAYRLDGRSRPAYDPAMMGLLMYAYARGNRSSRRIERACVEDVASRVITANRAPDHSTIAEFRVRHKQPLADLFGGVLELCKQAGLVSVGVIAVDGTKVMANASSYANVDYRRVAREILDEIVSRGTQVLIPPDAKKRKGARAGWTGGAYAWMRTVLAHEPGRGLYNRRSVMIEPVFADEKHNRKIDRFQRRGRTAVLSQWRLINATHDLLKLHRHRLAIATG